MEFERMVQEASQTINVEAAIALTGIALMVGIAIMVLRHRKISK